MFCAAIEVNHEMDGCSVVQHQTTLRVNGWVLPIASRLQGDTTCMLATLWFREMLDCIASALPPKAGAAGAPPAGRPQAGAAAAPYKGAGAAPNPPPKVGKAGLAATQGKERWKGGA